MRRRFRRNIAAATLIFGAAACTTPHHSNALIFGTNTSFGIDVGQNATGVPSILVGYRRQEAVFMPLVASIAYDANGVPTPCNVYPDIVDPASVTLIQTGESGLRGIPPCFLVGQNGGAVDAYSVLASFGAQFAAEATQPRASGGLAQFFATGIAAQVLAVRGGPALVATGPAAAAAGAADNSAGIAALYNAEEVTERVTVLRSEGETNRDALAAFIQAHTTTDNFAAQLAAVEQAAGAPAGTLTMGLCQGGARDACLARLNSGAGLRFVSLNNFGWKAAADTVGGDN